LPGEPRPLLDGGGLRVHRNQVVLVDDGSCQKGMIKRWSQDDLVSAPATVRRRHEGV